MKLCSGCLHSGERQYENLCLDATREFWGRGVASPARRQGWSGSWALGATGGSVLGSVADREGPPYGHPLLLWAGALVCPVGLLTWYLPCEGHHPTSLCGSQHFSLPATQAESQPTPRVTPAFGECRQQTPEAFLCRKLCQGSRVTPR